MRLGGHVLESFDGPEGWVAALKRLNFSAAYCPIDEKQSSDVIHAYEKAAREADVMIAEVGAWSNPLSPDETNRRKAVAYCQARLALADAIGARCCVNIAGSRGEENGRRAPHPDSLTQTHFDLIVESVRTIIDAVKPTRTFYVLEMMPWLYPDTADNYVRLLRAIDRKAFAVHIDPVNIITSPQRYYNNAEVIRDAFTKLGPWVKSCHAKDIILRNALTIHMDEAHPGQGALDYRVFLQEIEKLGPDTPLMIEHLKTTEEYAQAADYIRSVARQVGITVKSVT